MSAELQQVWKSSNETARRRIIEALAVRYTNGDRPTYRANSLMSVSGVYRKAPDAVARSVALMGGEKFSPSSITFTTGLETGKLALTPLDPRLMKEGLRSVFLSVDQALIYMDGFAEHMQDVIDKINDDTMAEVQQSMREREELEAREAQERMSMLNSDEWGEF